MGYGQQDQRLLFSRRRQPGNQKHAPGFLLCNTKLIFSLGHVTFFPTLSIHAAQESFLDFSDNKKHQN